MKVKCLFNQNKDVPTALRLNSDLPTAEYDLRVGGTYDIFGQAIYAGVLIYLIDPENLGRPNWYPAELFEITDQRVPASWRFHFFGQEYRADLGALWGYSALVDDPGHFNDLAERVEGALRAFVNAKASSIVDQNKRPVLK